MRDNIKHKALQALLREELETLRETISESLGTGLVKSSITRTEQERIKSDCQRVLDVLEEI